MGHTEAVLRPSRPRFCVASDVEVATQGAMPGHGSVHTFAGGWGAPLAGVPPCTLQLCPRMAAQPLASDAPFILLTEAQEPSKHRAKCLKEHWALSAGRGEGFS